MPAPFISIRHEAGDTSEYDALVGTGVSVTQAAALNSTGYGLQAVCNSAVNRYGRKDYTAAASRYYRFRFYFDPNGFALNVGEIISVFETQSSSGSIREQVRFGRAVGGLYVRGVIKDDGSNLLATGDYTITDAPHLIEVLVTRASTNVAANGSLSIWVDGVLQGTRANVDLFDLTRPTRMCLGAVRNISVTTIGTLYLDELQIVDADAFDAAPAWTLVAELDAITENYVLTGLTNATSYDVSIRTVDAADNESTGVEATATPLDFPDPDPPDPPFPPPPAFRADGTQKIQYTHTSVDRLKVIDVGVAGTGGTSLDWRQVIQKAVNGAGQLQIVRV